MEGEWPGSLLRLSDPSTSCATRKCWEHRGSNKEAEDELPVDVERSTGSHLEPILTTCVGSIPCPTPQTFPRVITMPKPSKRKNPAIVSPTHKRVKRVPADDNSTGSPSRATSPHGTVADAADGDDEPLATEDENGKSWHYTTILILTHQRTQ